jgi:hypothetical protein
LFSFKIWIFEQSVQKVSLTKLGRFDSPMTIKHREQACALAIDVVVADVGVFHAHAPALHR